jgi:hypothetical protein
MLVINLAAKDFTFQGLNVKELRRSHDVTRVKPRFIEQMFADGMRVLPIGLGYLHGFSVYPAPVLSSV